jgi:hypothetical protein
MCRLEVSAPLIPFVPPEVALCMTPEERDGWYMWDKRVANSSGGVPCSDCTPEFAAEMRSAYRCNGVPGVRYCSHCKAWWPLDLTHWTSRTLFGRVGARAAKPRDYTERQCRACYRKYGREWARRRRARAKPCPVSLPAGGQMKEKT